MARCPAHGNRIQLNPSRAVNLFGAPLNQIVVGQQVSRWRQAAQDANAKPVLTIAEQKELEKLRADDQREIKALKKGLLKKPKPLQRKLFQRSGSDKLIRDGAILDCCNC